jgi:hypothetical protein
VERADRMEQKFEGTERHSSRNATEATKKGIERSPIILKKIVLQLNSLFSIS